MSGPPISKSNYFRTIGGDTLLAGRQDSYLAIYGGKGDKKMRQLYIQVNKQEMARQHYHWCGNLKPLLKDKKIYY